MKKDEIEKQIEELTRVRPELLNEEALKLFNLIMNRLDYIEELERELKEKNEDIAQYEVEYHEMAGDIHRLEEELKEAKDNEESANSTISDLLDEIDELKQEIKHWKNGFEQEHERNAENTLELLKQDEQLRKKDKIIDLMARAIDSLDSQLVICKYKDKEDVKKKFEEYFERKVEKWELK